MPSPPVRVVRELVPKAHPLLIQRGQKVRPQEVDGRGPWVWFSNVLENTFDTIHLVEGKVAQAGVRGSAP